jgi:hypothetical protein
VFASCRHLEKSLHKDSNISYTNFRTSVRRAVSRRMCMLVGFSMAACRRDRQNSGVMHAGIRLWVECTYLPASSSTNFSNHDTAVPLSDKTEATHNMDPSNENGPSGGSAPNNLSEFRSGTSRMMTPRSTQVSRRRLTRSAATARQVTCAALLRSDHITEVPPALMRASLRAGITTARTISASWTS